jgi:hypothetical protein
MLHSFGTGIWKFALGKDYLQLNSQLSTFFFLLPRLFISIDHPFTNFITIIYLEIQISKPFIRK